VFKLKKVFLLLCSFLPNIADARFFYYSSGISRALQVKTKVNRTPTQFEHFLFVCAVFLLTISCLLMILYCINSFNESIEAKQSQKEKEEEERGKEEIEEIAKSEKPLIRSIEEFNKQKDNKK
jgi:large-conductance mechanosensitive channel